MSHSHRWNVLYQSYSDIMSVSKAPIPQNDNVAHALAGAGGGILSMVLTYGYTPHCYKSVVVFV